MTDLFRGYDLTTIADEVAQTEWDRLVAQRATAGVPGPVWDNLDKFTRQQFKSNLLPIITAVLDAIDKAEANAIKPKQMVDYDYANADRTDPRWYENQDHQHDVTTATVWVLHLHVRPEDKDAVLERMALHACPTGEYTYGDSWRQWMETSEGDDDVRLGIYINAPTDSAARLADTLALNAAFASRNPNIATDYALSTAGDFAEQLPVSP